MNMFDTLTASMEASEVSPESLTSDEMLEMKISELEANLEQPLESALEGELHDLEDLATIVSEHGLSPDLFSFLNRDGSLESLLGMDAETIQSMDKEDLSSALMNIVVSEEDDFGLEEVVWRTIHVHPDSPGARIFKELKKLEKADLEKELKKIGEWAFRRKYGLGPPKGGVLVAARFWLGGFLRKIHAPWLIAIILALSIVGIIPVFKKRREGNLSGSQESRQWSPERARTRSIRGVSKAAMQERFKAPSEFKVLKTALFSSLPENQQDYTAWTRKVDTAMKHYKDIYGIHVKWSKGLATVMGPRIREDKKVIVSDHQVTSATPEAFGYKDADIKTIDAQIVRTFDALIAIAEKDRKDGETAWRKFAASVDVQGTKKLTKEEKARRRFQLKALKVGVRIYDRCLRSFTKSADLGRMITAQLMKDIRE